MPDTKLGKESLLAIKDYIDGKAGGIEQELSTKQDVLVSGANIKTINNNSVLGSGNIDIVPMVETTWAALKALRDGGNLVPGQQYRITDYQCTTTTANTSSAGHQFDIIVVADSATKLNEKARACLHAGDTYFANSWNFLEAWQLWYCLDNDFGRFAWADATNGKGVIYRMIDEFGNDIPYDFKNILFTKSGKYTNSYTFTSSGDEDASLLGLDNRCYSNVMVAYFSTKQELNFNVFYSTGRSLYCYSNTFGTNCKNNTFSNTCISNKFGNDCMENTFENQCAYNTFGTQCRYNTFGDNCSNNTFGSYCKTNTFGNGCQYITFGDSSSAMNYYQYNIIDNGCQYLYIVGNGTASSSNYLKNIHIRSGVVGASSSNRRTITVDRNLAYSTDIYANGSKEIILND